MGVRPDPLDHGRYWDATLNVVGGCEFAHRFVDGRKIVDPSCVNCYAVTYAAGIHAKNEVELYRGTTERKGARDTWSGPDHLTVLVNDHRTWNEPLRWRGVTPNLLELDGQGKDKPSILWVNSEADLFHPGRPREAIDRILENVAISPHNIIGLIVVKYCEQLVEYFSTKPAWWRKRFILVFSAGNQYFWDWRWSIMRPLAEAGWIVGTSIQPMLGLVVLPPDSLTLLRWVIVGGEQHPGHRVMEEDWAYALRDQCKAAGLPFFVKQMTTGGLPLGLWYRELPKV